MKYKLLWKTPSDDGTLMDVAAYAMNDEDAAKFSKQIDAPVEIVEWDGVIEE